MNYYPEQLRAIAAYCEALDTAEKDSVPESMAIYVKELSLTDEGGTDWGVIRDEIGGAFSWFPVKS